MKYTNRIIDPTFARLNGVLLHGPIIIPATTRIWLFTDYIEAESWIMDSRDRIDSGTVIVGISSQYHMGDAPPQTSVYCGGIEYTHRGALLYGGPNSDIWTVNAPGTIGGDTTWKRQLRSPSIPRPAGTSRNRKDLHRVGNPQFVLYTG